LAGFEPGIFCSGGGLVYQFATPPGLKEGYILFFEKTFIFVTQFTKSVNCSFLVTSNYAISKYAPSLKFTLKICLEKLIIWWRDSSTKCFFSRRK
jgi:hypothetical protein